MENIAVLTGNIAHSTKKIDDKLIILEQELTKELQLSRENIFEQSNNYFFYRGDSFQLVLSSPNKALEIALFLRLKALLNNSDLRIAIGIGKMQTNTGKINHSQGDAFVYSDKALNNIGKRMIVLATGNNIFDEPINVMLRLAEPIMNKWSVEKAEAVYYHLKGFNQKEIARKVGRSQVAIHKRLVSANYEDIKLLLDYFENLF